MAQVQQGRMDPLYSDIARRVPAGPPQGAGNAAAPPDRVNFSGGFPDPKSFPTKELAAVTARVMERDGATALQYGSAQGYKGLIEQLRLKLKRDNDVDVGPENILITSGASQAIDLVCTALLNPGDVVISEEPTWMGAVRMFGAHEAKVVGVPMDDEGMRLDILEAKLAEMKTAGVQPKFIYCIPSFQNPTGISTPLHRRIRLLELAKEYNVAVMDDDAYYDLRFSGENLPMLYTLDKSGLVIYTGTFSKILSAGMRLGWAVGPAPLIEKMAKLKADGGNSFTGHIAAEYAATALESHIGELVQIYKSRRDTMLAALKQEMPQGVTWSEPKGGFFLWLTLPQGYDSVAMLPEARAHGVEFLPGTGCYFDGRGKENIRLSFSFSDEEAITRGIKILGGILREYAPQR